MNDIFKAKESAAKRSPLPKGYNIMHLYYSTQPANVNDIFKAQSPTGGAVGEKRTPPWWNTQGVCWKKILPALARKNPARIAAKTGGRCNERGAKDAPHYYYITYCGNVNDTFIYMDFYSAT